jgi:hypothetical protein
VNPVRVDATGDHRFAFPFLFRLSACSVFGCDRTHGDGDGFGVMFVSAG